MSADYTKVGLATAWESGYWHGISHEGPLNDASVAACNPYKTAEGRDASPKSVTAAEPTNS